MLDSIIAFLEASSFLAVFRQLSSMSTTDVVVVFLVSKPVFIAAAGMLVGFRPARQAISAFLESERTNAAHLLE